MGYLQTNELGTPLSATIVRDTEKLTLPGSGIRLRPQQPNHVWVYGFVAGSRAKVQDHPHVKYGGQVSVFETFQM